MFCKFRGLTSEIAGYFMTKNRKGDILVGGVEIYLVEDALYRLGCRPCSAYSCKPEVISKKIAELYPGTSHDPREVSNTLNHYSPDLFSQRRDGWSLTRSGLKDYENRKRG